ncbi:hypothetical protein [Mesorhizobium sp. M0496]|uniref:hypothetical protein n=1 Tax=Mesorhizobium sp. M0496 TaxID=2956952 RepID=UPI00333DB465
MTDVAIGEGKSVLISRSRIKPDGHDGSVDSDFASGVARAGLGSTEDTLADNPTVIPLEHLKDSDGPPIPVGIAV